MTHGLRMMFDDVPEAFVQKLREFLSYRGLEGIVNLETGRNIWVGRSQRENPQSLVEGRYYEREDATLLRPYDPSVYFHEVVHRGFQKRLNASFSQLREQGDHFGEALAFMLQTAIFGDEPGAKEYLSQSNIYKREEASAYQRLLNLYYMAGNSFIKNALSPDASFWEHIFGKKEKTIAKILKVKDVAINWEFALQNPNILLREPKFFRVSTLTSTDKDQIKQYFDVAFGMPPKVAEAIMEEGDYGTLQDAVFDLSPSKIDRINAFHRLTSGLILLAGYNLAGAHLEAGNIVTSNTYEISLKALNDYEKLLSVGYEIGGEKLAKTIADLVLTKPSVTHSLKENLEQILAAAGSSRKSAREFTEKLSTDKDFREFIVIKGGGDIIDNYAYHTGRVFTSEYIHHLSGLNFNFDFRPDYNQYTISFKMQMKSINAYVELTDQRDVLELLPKAFAAATLSAFFEGVRRCDDENSTWRNYTRMVKSLFPELGVPIDVPISVHNKVFADSLLFHPSYPIFIQMYQHSKQREKTNGKPWKETMHDYVDRFYDATNKFIAEHPKKL